MTPLQIFGLMIQVGIEVLKLYREQAAAKGQKLTTADKKAVNAAIVAAIKTKDTSKLEALLKGTSTEPAPLGDK